MPAVRLPILFALPLLGYIYGPPAAILAVVIGEITYLTMKGAIDAREFPAHEEATASRRLDDGAQGQGHDNAECQFHDCHFAFWADDLRAFICIFSWQEDEIGARRPPSERSRVSQAIGAVYDGRGG